VMDSYTSVTEQLQDYQSVYDIESLTAAHEDLNALISSLEEQIDSLATL
jgi:prefoldin subunit 5